MRPITYAMMLSLDGYVAGPPGAPGLPPPGVALHQHFNDMLRGMDLILYGRGMYETMRFWETAGDAPDADAVTRDFAEVWKTKPKLVCSTTLKSVGPGARLVGMNAVAEIATLKAQTGGPMEVSGPGLAASLSHAGLIDEYRLYFRPFVLGGGKPFFKDARTPKLALIGTETMPEDTVLVRYRPKT